MNRIYSHPTIVSNDTGKLQLGGSILREEDIEHKQHDVLRWGSDLFIEDVGDIPPVADLLIVDQRPNFEGDLPAALESAIRQLDQRNETSQSLVFEQTTQWRGCHTRLIRVYTRRNPRRWSATDETEHVVMMRSRNSDYLRLAANAAERRIRDFSVVGDFSLATSTEVVGDENWSWLTIMASVGILKQLPPSRFGFPLVGDHGEVEITLNAKAATVATRSTMANSLEMDCVQAGQLLLLADWQQHDDVWLHSGKPHLIAMIGLNDDKTACKIEFHVRQLAGAS
jgi:hypothetical protein